jgi:hypothetical protein
MDVEIRARAHWLVSYGLARATLKLLARRGDPLAQLVIDSSRPENAHHVVEQICGLDADTSGVIRNATSAGRASELPGARRFDSRPQGYPYGSL